MKLPELYEGIDNGDYLEVLHKQRLCSNLYEAGAAPPGVQRVQLHPLPRSRGCKHIVLHPLDFEEAPLKIIGGPSFNALKTLRRSGVAPLGGRRGSRPSPRPAGGATMYCRRS